MSPGESPHKWLDATGDEKENAWLDTLGGGNWP